eukprot:9492917-Heterocapsa_arctica.AAC.1
MGLVDTFAYYVTEKFIADFDVPAADISTKIPISARGFSGEGSWIIKSKAGYYCAAFDEHDVYEIICPAMALPMKQA